MIVSYVYYQAVLHLTKTVQCQDKKCPNLVLIHTFKMSGQLSNAVAKH